MDRLLDKIINFLSSLFEIAVRVIVRLSVCFIVILATSMLLGGNYNTDKNDFADLKKKNAQLEEKISERNKILSEQKRILDSSGYIAYTQRIEGERAEAERVAAEKAAAEKAEAERVAAEKAEAERLAAEKAEAKRVAAEKAAAERLAAEAKSKAKQEGVRIGMTQQEVLDSNWGKPQDINRTTTEYGVSEQWVYRGYNYLYFEDGILTGIQN